MTLYDDLELANWSPEYMAYLEKMASHARAIRQLKSDFDKLTWEQKWDLENEEFFDPAIFREIQAETQS